MLASYYQAGWSGAGPVTSNMQTDRRPGVQCRARVKYCVLPCRATLGVSGRTGLPFPQHAMSRAPWRLQTSLDPDTHGKSQTTSPQRTWAWREGVPASNQRPCVSKSADEISWSCVLEADALF